MYACLKLAGTSKSIHELLDLALEFSPAVEQTSGDTLVFCITPLRQLIGSPHQIAAEICRLGYERKLQANLAMAANPDTAILLARYFIGVTLVTPGEEQLKLASIPLTAFFTPESSFDVALLEVLHRWGIKTCEDLAALPERGVSERLGEPGILLRNLARGVVHRPLRLPAPSINYEQHTELEYPLELLEPLLFLLGSALADLCQRLRSQSRAARLLKLQLELEAHPPYQCELEFPLPLEDSRTMLKLLQLHLERHPTQAPIKAFTLRLHPTACRRVQGDIFLPPTPPADKLQVTLARIAGLVGPQNVGTPVLLNTHRPDAFQLTALPGQTPVFQPNSLHAQQPEVLRLAMRLFRPALEARVRVVELAPKDVLAAGVKGRVLRSAGPWKTAGEWWTLTAWCREEWDVALDDGALYRIYKELDSQQKASEKWFVHGVYD